MKRLLLFSLTNLAVLLVLSVMLRLLGLDAILARRGVDMGSLLVLAAVIGFSGAFISLMMSKWTAIHLTGVRLIREPDSAAHRDLLAMVQQHAERMGIAMPEVGVFDTPEMNAFATGARRDRALVAVSSGLLQGVSAEQLNAVLGHEITHVGNGDMVTLALIQGVVNTFVIFLARVFGTLLDSALGGTRQERRGPGPFYFLLVILLQILLGVLANIVVMWFSRRREFRADRGGARLAGTANMIGALERLEQAHNAALPRQLVAFGICGSAARGLTRLFMSHPPIPERIAALREAAWMEGFT